MSTDRMVALFGPAAGGADTQEVTATDIELMEAGAGKTNQPRGGNKYASFFAEVDAVKKDNEKIKLATMQLKSSTQAFKSATNDKREALVKEQVKQLLRETKPLCLNTKAKIKALKAKMSDQSLDHAEKRMRMQTFGVITKVFVQAIKDYQEAQAGYENAVRNQQARRLQIVDKNLEEKEIEKIIDEGRAEEVFKQVIRDGKGTLANKYRDVMETNAQLLELAKSMKELMDMYQDMAALVELQGEKLTSIEENMDNAVDYVEKGTKHVERATKYQKSKRKQMCCCIIIGLIIIVVIITPILVTSLNNA